MAKKLEPEEYKLPSKIPATTNPADHDSTTNILPTSLVMVTWNITGSMAENYFATIRDTLVPIVRQLLPTNCVSFLQEISTGAQNVVRWGFGDLAVSPGGGKKEAGVSTPQSGGSGKALIELGDILHEDKLKDLGVKDELTKRMYGRNVTMRRKVGESEYVGNITVISYHAQYKTDDRKKKMIECFQIMCNLADKLKQTIVIGGDFNLSVHDWKEEVEMKCQGRVSVALYVPSPRRWVPDKLLDTFAIVQPSSIDHQTAASEFIKTMAIYPFPMASHVGGDQKTGLLDYPSREKPWFKYVHFGNEDLAKVERVLKQKVGSDVQKSIKKEAEEAKRKKLEEDVQTLIQELERTRLSDPFTKIDQQAPAPLWPNSPLHQVLDHDPVLTMITVFLKKNIPTQDNTSATPGKRETRSTRQ